MDHVYTLNAECIETWRNQALELCYAIETLPASEQQTALSLKATALANALVMKPLEPVKLGEMTQLIGRAITKVKHTAAKQELFLTCDDGAEFVLRVDDEHHGYNDSHAYIDSVVLNRLFGLVIVNVEETNRDSYGVELVIHAGTQRGHIKIVHDHNGYYGFSWELVKV